MKNIIKCCRIVSRDSLCIELHGVLTMILRDTQSRARVSFFLYLFVFFSRHAISPLVSPRIVCQRYYLHCVMAIICLRPSRCGEMMEQGRTADSNSRLLLLSRERKTDGGIFVETFL